MRHKTVALLMAAGSSSRYGSDKRFAQLPSGKSAIEQSLQVIIEAGIDYRIVVREEDLENDFFSKFERKLLIVNPDPDRGLSSSISAGIRDIEMQYDSCLICLADMPFVRTETLLQLVPVLAFSECLAAVPVNDAGSEQWGHPVGIKKNLFFLFSHLEGDQGGKQVLQSIGDLCVKVKTDDTGIYRDIDKPSDLH